MSRPMQPAVVDVLCVSPSVGSGGGIERYAAAAVEYLFDAGVRVERHDLIIGARKLTAVHKLLFVARLWRAARSRRRPFAVVVLHPALALAAWCVTATRRRTRTVVVFHGVDLWGPRRVALERLLRHRNVQAVTTSAFGAGALVRTAQATVLTPGLGRQWYTQLLAAGRQRAQHDGAPLRVLTAFRLASWREKGLAELIAAVASLRDRWPVELQVVGSGPTDAGLTALAAAHPWLQVQRQPTDEDLARAYASADVFVLATRTRAGRAAQGEGFGLVLVEAQLAGTPVVAPAHGGSADAFLPGVTGISPVDESAGALRDALELLVSDSGVRRRMGSAGASWAAVRFAPDAQRPQYVQVLGRG